MLRDWPSQFLRAAGSFVFIAVITVLIWLYAEGENIRRDDATMDLQLTAPSGRQLLIHPTHRSIQVAYTCAADQSAQFRAMLQEPFLLEVNEDPTQSDQIILLRDRLSADPRIARLGINIVDVQPATLPVSVESIVPVTLPVRIAPLESALAETVNVNPLPEPAQATVLLPSSVARRATSQTALEVTIDPQRLTGLSPNIAHRLTLPLTLSADLRDGSQGFNATIEPSTVSLSVTVRTLTAEITVSAVPVRLVVNPGDLRVFDAPTLADDHVRNLILRGPRHVIKDIEEGKLALYAELRLSAEDLDAAARNRDGAAKLPVINAPAGVTVSNLTTPVRYTVTRRP